MVSSCKKQQKEKLLSYLKKSLNDFTIENDTSADTVGKETAQPQPGILVNSFGRSAVIENRTSHDQVFEGKLADKIRKEFDIPVTAVEIRVHDAILTATGNVVIPRVEMAVRSITESSGPGPNSVVRSPD